MLTAPSAEASRLIPAAAADIFELLATPRQHALIDGSGQVRGAQDRTPERLSAGARFGMQMHWGLPYKILNEVVEFEEGRRIAWRHFGGHVWRYVLEPVDATSTRVTEQFDARPSRSPLVLLLIRAASRNQRAIEQTLIRLEGWARDRTPGGAGLSS
ncbi:SRPBCC family protein [uncultured Friedmanniella sp.]|uniref:SRPBCC family protein n=1 Tax=uncultured Friedmanniella sp. TaxID=335381 RepID=UPI0035CCA18A